ncbi:putative cytochrome P450 [Medicago truncatula]|uniref:Cytochrome P450 family 709 protein n=1 Tax=Medicago truncatula TaxID=3880 RepID=A0A072VYL9_MEDTR|nr:cytochrome P450 709B2 [Medicago truncatula]KEH43175.1 cytochrome P450 family 709 protein [Medicago truncatula]RHN80953.1 putative cytochrome P450 [Medicago truncatula]
MGYLIAIAIVTFTIMMMSKIWRVCVILFWRPYAMTRHFRKQGVIGPPYSLVSGSLHDIKTMMKDARNMVMDKHSNDITQRVLPHYQIWSSLYGERFLYWYGTEPRICISDVELAKEILSNKFGFYAKPKTRPSIVTMIGEGLAIVNGVEWVRRRRILNPAFSMDKLKVMISRMAACTISMLEEWKKQAIETKEKSKKIEMTEEFRELTANIIAHTAFGTSFVHGREAFDAQTQLHKHCVASNSDVFIPGTQYFPTKSNIEIWKLDRKMKKSLQCIIESRLQNSQSDCSYGDDLLGVMMDTEKTNDHGSKKLKMNEIMDECKTFFFAGHETTSNLLNWTVFLLSLHKDWQDKLRQEVQQICGMEIPDADMLSKLKMVNMVLLEALRLYCPAIQLERVASQDMKLGNLIIPQGTCLTIPITMIHTSKKYWGEDANEFNPMRFINGISKASNHPNALLAFSVGPRNCIGQNFAMLEAKTVMTLILQRFSWSLSSDYEHAPVNNLTLQPQHGLPIIIKPLQL